MSIDTLLASPAAPIAAADVPANTVPRTWRRALGHGYAVAGHFLTGTHPQLGPVTLSLPVQAVAATEVRTRPAAAFSAPADPALDVCDFLSRAGAVPAAEFRIAARRTMVDPRAAQATRDAQAASFAMACLVGTGSDRTAAREVAATALAVHGFDPTAALGRPALLSKETGVSVAALAPARFYVVTVQPVNASVPDETVTLPSAVVRDLVETVLESTAGPAWAAELAAVGTRAARESLAASADPVVADLLAGLDRLVPLGALGVVRTFGERGGPAAVLFPFDPETFAQSAQLRRAVARTVAGDVRVAWTSSVAAPATV